MTAISPSLLPAGAPLVLPAGTVRISDLSAAYHDHTCPEGPECRDRPLHVMSNRVMVDILVDVLNSVGVRISGE